MRKSLYVKDDDYRLSFLHGNYITLTDLGGAEIQRIIDQHLSPLYISVHATDPGLRHLLLGEPRIRGDLLGTMTRLARAGIKMHAQIVLCPDLNDGVHLERSVWELAGLHPHVATVAVVPVGLTRFRERLYPLRSITPEEASDLLGTIHDWQARALERLGSRFVFPADELYLLAGETIPSARRYEGFPIVEDGIGLTRRFLDRFPAAVRRLPKRVTSTTVTVATGMLFSPILEPLLKTISTEGLDVRLVSIPNDFFGHGITVAGLLTGEDLLKHLSHRELGDRVIIPNVTLRDGEGVFLDDLTPRDLEERLGVPVRMVEPTPGGLCRALLR